MNLFTNNDEKDAIVKVYAVADGELIKMEEVNDITFARRMMGNGYAIRPKNGIITSPVEGEITQLFPTKHVVGFQTKGLELLLHMGIDTVSLKGVPFKTGVTEGEQVTSSSLISEVDLEMLRRENKNDEMIVIFVNGRKVIKSFEMYDLKEVTRGQEIGFLTLQS